VTSLHRIQEAVRLRSEAITSTQANWPCRKGCDECCRRLASAPRISADEWQGIAAALDALPREAGERVRQRIRASAGASRPVTCPLLDRDSGTCLVYEVRPIACRAYGFYAERERVLGCSRIESVGEQAPDVVWGNHAALEEQLRSLGVEQELAEWLPEE
jgi:Fe-S-cluster containining protein